MNTSSQNEALRQSQEHLAERTEQRDEAQAGREKAEDATRILSEFLAHMSHELRTPLNSIIGFSKALLVGVHGDISNKKHLEFINDIRNSGQHLLSLINDVLDLSKIGADELELVESDIALGQMVDSCVRMIKGRADAQTLIIRSDYSEELPRLRGDERLIKQIVLNLLSNAVKYCEADECIDLLIEVGGDGRVSIVVSDSGPGIAEKDIKRILEPFGQARMDSQLTHEGTGLGLSLSKQFVELHGGSLTIESERGRGTKVLVIFPPERTVVV